MWLVMIWDSKVSHNAACNSTNGTSVYLSMNAQVCAPAIIHVMKSAKPLQMLIILIYLF